MAEASCIAEPAQVGTTTGEPPKASPDKMRKVLTLVLLVTEGGNKVLLGMKKRGFGKGRWNGFGGKVEQGESIEQAAARELEEEANIRAKHLEKQGLMEFEFQNDPTILQVHMFKATEFEGDIRESEEMKPQWFSKEEIPFDSMWPDDRYWFSWMLNDRKFEAFFLFKDHDCIIDYSMREVESL